MRHRVWRAPGRPAPRTRGTRHDASHHTPGPSWSCTGLVGATLVAPPAGAAPTWRPVTNLFADLSAAGGSAFTPGHRRRRRRQRDRGVVALRTARSTSCRRRTGRSAAPGARRSTSPAGRMILDPQVVVDPAGNATAVWRRVDADRSVVQTASRPAGGAWSAPVDLSTDPSVDYSQRPTSRSSPWTRPARSPRPGRASRRPRASRGGSPSSRPPARPTAPGPRRSTSPPPAAPPGRPTSPSTRPATPPRSWAAGAVAPGRQPARRRRLDRARRALRHRRAARQPAGRGRPGRHRDRGLGQLRRRRVRRADRLARARRRLDRPARPGARGGLRHPGDRRRPPGQRHRASGSSTTARAGSSRRATRAAGGAWSTPVPLSTPGRDSWDPQVAVDLAGNATALWSRAEDGGRVVEAARRPAGGEWSEPVDLSAGGDAWNPQIAVDPAGNATAAWSRKDGTSWIVQARGLDAAGPVVTEITGATSRRSGRARAYSVKAHDVWSRSPRPAGPSPTAPPRPAPRCRTPARAARGRSGSCSPTASATPPPAPTPAPSPAARPRGSRRHRPRPALARTEDPRRRLGRPGGEEGQGHDRALHRRQGDLHLPQGGSKPVRLVKKLDAGRNVVAVRARLGAGKVLAPGRWKVVVTAKNRFGTSTKERLRLRVVR